MTPRLAVRRGLCAVLLATAAAPVAPGSPAQPADPLAWPAPTQTSRPWARWWWLGSAVDQENLERLLTDYRDAGLGGVEICPIYGAKGYETRFIDYLSPKWMDMLATATRTAAGLGIGVDMTTGTGWPMGGPWIPDDQASESVTLRRLPLGPGGRVPESLAGLLSGREAGDGPTGAGGRPVPMDGLVGGAADRPQLLCLRAVGPDGAQVDLTERVRSGQTGWAAPGAGWTLYALAGRQPVQRVKRAAPGGAGNVVDPFSVGALDIFLSRFDAAFRTYGGAMPRAQFQDSFEYFGANWTPGFLGEFAGRRGYDLRERLPELAGDGNQDAAARVREDYRRTIGELHLSYVARWTLWSHRHGSLTREQAHGAPANIEDVYAAADIPETEGTFGGGTEDQVPMLKFASSAAHVTGRTLASSETFTWLGEHFQVPLAQLKGVLDTFLLSGINHMFFHGIPYSPEDAPWPGWLFYASVNFGPNGGLWHDLPSFNAYATRCQSVLQSGKPDNDLLLYFPVADYWQHAGPPAGGAPPGARGDPLVVQFTTPGKWMQGTPFHDNAMELWRRGFAFDEVTDALLEGAHAVRAPADRAAGGFAITLGGNLYRAVLVPPCRYMPVDTLRRLLDLARAGATVVFAAGIPTDVPGLANLDARRAEIRRLAGEVTLGPLGGGPLASRLGAGLVVSGGNSPTGGLLALLTAAAVPRESMADDGLLCVRRLRGGGSDYFVVNTGGRPVGAWEILSRTATSALLMDPLVPNRAGFAATRSGREGLAVFLQMAPGQSLVLRTFTGAAPSGPAWSDLLPEAGRTVELGGDWSVHFTEGGPALPRDYRSPHLGSWTERDDPEARRFAGTAIYSLRFTLPAQERAALDWRLDLGRVAESARVRLNGREVTTLWCEPFSTNVGRYLSTGENQIEIEVTNVAANRIRDLDRRRVNWKSFYEINFVNRGYRPFDASEWLLRDSGLLGPVTLTPMDAVQRPPAPAVR